MDKIEFKVTEQDGLLRISKEEMDIMFDKIHGVEVAKVTRQERTVIIPRSKWVDIAEAVQDEFAGRWR